jgi:hypothetical protein
MRLLFHSSALSSAHHDWPRCAMRPRCVPAFSQKHSVPITHIHIYIHTHIHTYIHSYMHSYIRTTWVPWNALLCPWVKHQPSAIPSHTAQLQPSHPPAQPRNCNSGWLTCQNMNAWQPDRFRSAPSNNIAHTYQPQADQVPHTARPLKAVCSAPHCLSASATRISRPHGAVRWQQPSSSVQEAVHTPH